MQVRKPVTELAPGDFVVRIGKHEVNGTYQATEPVHNHDQAVGPRGGHYTLVQPMNSYRGEIEHLKVVHTTAGDPIVRVDATATIEAPEEW